MSRLTAVAAVFALALFAPAAALADGPAAPQIDAPLLAGSTVTADDSVDFVFTADDPSDTFLCALDGDTRDVCEADPTIGPLSEGQHTLTVWAVDDFDGTIGDSADFTFTVDLTEPGAPEIDGPPAMTNDADTSLTFTGEDGGTYECRLDTEDVVEDCTSPFVPSDPVSEDYHEFSVWQTDDAGHVGAAATYSWTVDQTAPDAPALDGDVAAVTGASRATFTFSGEPSGHFECSLNGAPFVVCTSPKTYTGLGADFDELAVLQVDDAGNIGNQALLDWQVDPSLNPPAPTHVQPGPVTPPLVAPITPPTPASPAPETPATSPKPSTTPPTGTKPVSSVKHVTRGPRCVSRRSVTLHWHVPKGHRIVTTQLIVNGRIVSTLRPGAVAATVSLAGRRQGVVHVIVRARDDDGVRLQTDRSYATCVAPNAHTPLHSLVLQVSWTTLSA